MRLVRLEQSSDKRIGILYSWSSKGFSMIRHESRLALLCFTVNQIYPDISWILKHENFLENETVDEKNAVPNFLFIFSYGIIIFQLHYLQPILCMNSHEKHKYYRNIVEHCILYNIVRIFQKYSKRHFPCFSIYFAINNSLFQRIFILLWYT